MNRAVPDVQNPEGRVGQDRDSISTDSHRQNPELVEHE